MANVKRKQLFYLDSLPSIGYENRLKKYINNWASFWSSKEKDENWQFVYLTDQHQTDSYNCGVFVCYYFYLIINDNDIDIYKKNDKIDDFRKYIYEKIIDMSH